MTTFSSTKGLKKPYFSAFKKLNIHSTNLYTNYLTVNKNADTVYILTDIGGLKCRLSTANIYILIHYFYYNILFSLYLYPHLSTIYMLFYSFYSTFWYTSSYSDHHSFLQMITHDTTYFSTKYPGKPLFIAECYLINNESIVVKKI